MITPELLLEFKARMKLGDDEDANLYRILKASHQRLYGLCGKRDIETDEAFKELVFERARYAYNDALEYFDDNFLSDLITLGLEKVLGEIEVEEG